MLMVDASDKSIVAVIVKDEVGLFSCIHEAVNSFAITNFGKFNFWVSCENTQ